MWSKMPHQLRNRSRPMGLPNLPEADGQKVAMGNRLLAVSEAVMKECIQCGIPFVLENPATSWAWATPALTRLRACPAVSTTSLCQCQYGTAHRKATRLLLGPKLCGEPYLAAMCHGRRGQCSITGKPHDILTGFSAGGQWKTFAAKEYPAQLCRAIANSFRATFATDHIAQVSKTLQL